MPLSRGSFIRLSLAGAADFAVGCRTAGGTGLFRFTVLNPDCMAGGAGQCIVLQTPAGKTYLFDTGNGDFRGLKRKNNGKDIILPWLRAHGIEKLDGVVISHYHADHFGGFLWLWDHFPIARVFNNNYMPPGTRGADASKEYLVPRHVLDQWGAAHPGRLVENTKEGDDLGWNEDDVSFDVVWPPNDGYVKPLADRKGYSKGDNVFHHLLNANSTALRITAGGKVFFIVCDIQPDYVKAYMRPYLEKQGKWGADLVVLPSHGTKSEDAVADILAMRPRPHTVIASLGNLPWMVSCGKTVCRIYSQAGFEVFSTNVQGDLAAGPDAVVRADATKLYPYDPV